MVYYIKRKLSDKFSDRVYAKVRRIQLRWRRDCAILSSGFSFIRNRRGRRNSGSINHNWQSFFNLVHISSQGTVVTITKMQSCAGLIRSTMVKAKRFYLLLYFISLELFRFLHSNFFTDCTISGIVETGTHRLEGRDCRYFSTYWLHCNLYSTFVVTGKWFGLPTIRVLKV